MNIYQQQFLEWLQANDPAAYEILAIKAGAHNDELSGWEWLGTAWNGVKSAVKAVAPAVKEAAINVAKAKAQQKIEKKYGVKTDKTKPLTEQVQTAAIKKINEESERAIKPVKPKIIRQTYDNQSVIEKQLWRANNGLPPLQTPKYRPTIPPQQVARPVVRNAVINAGESKQITPAMMIGIAGLGIGLLRVFK